MIPLPLRPKIIEKKGNWAIFEIEALYPGYGVTIGNALRRVLLSSLPGAAVTQVKIKGVSHEFSTIPGVLEDVIMIILNLKQLRFKIYSDEPQKATLKVKEEKEVKGSDFELPSQVELVNKDAKIATLTDKKAELEMEILIEKGLGYQPVEKRKKEKLEIGVIPVDAIFTPIKRISFNIENMRVGERTDFDRLRLEIETDGTINPEATMNQAGEILVKHFSLIEESFKEAEKKPELRPVLEEDVLKTKVEDLKISKRTLHALQKNEIKTVGGILRKSEKSLLELEGMGERGIKEIKKALKKLNSELKE
ncbi:MAG: DNA-directed RNA polymerase subunit alpha [Candidatus Nealsonbacteria bacterium CG23_combo_of_CG06-09_8_20_14_all_36_12]|uniref:DNA-directed RNA polymerase subunit alpha n=2 Tax=Candidatus Nealsoniibacteriota TaxID=1817911 RepID=A0A2H0TLJ4_9BACT|nr:MAG: DNA-directed RNA polymerase subunit alpha [Candidatus Nealsonbacteria bacterium CG23_combo_of_CG06-09_8_20_14_all_36_12]PIR73030.1 MAG: DNA-directed RNA polymerase subunit alpha [Candidatus Nealsonbacteria bacterium CG10_big_fil_rev_8_21_14_0_10_36_23]